MSIDWDRFGGNSDFIRFAEIGDSVAGTITEIGMGQDFNGGPCPQLKIDTDEGEKTLTAGQRMLQVALAEKRPDVGDHVEITYYDNGPGKPGRAPAKLFKVEVIRAGEAAAVGAEDLV